MCGAGLHVRCWGGGVGGEVRQSRALGSSSPGAVAAHAGLVAVAVKTPVFFCKLARMNFLTIRGPLQQT